MTFMRSFPRALAILITAAVLAACSAGSANKVVPSAVQDHRVTRASWIDPAAKRGALLYVSDEDAGTVFIYTYPGLKPAGSLSGFSTQAGMCVDPKSGNVWITDTLGSDIVEFAHGGTTPIETLGDGAGFADGCAVNPVDDDLAVANNTVGGDDPGDVVIYPGGSGTPATYYDRRVLLMYYPAYDPQGNLFVDAQWYGHGGRLRLDELTSGGKKLSNVPWHGPKITQPSNVQYAGGNLAVGDGSTGTIYQTSGGSVLGTTTLNNACYVNQFYIERSRVIAPSFCNSIGIVSVYNYPAGGDAVRSLTGFQFPYGVVVSR